MTLEIALVLTILALALILFVFEWLRMDVVALMVLGALALTGLVSTAEALSGFSNPAVITVWAMFMISAGLTSSGVADRIGRQVLRFVGVAEARMVAVIMLTTGLLSAVMNNIGVAALLLPVIMDVARRTGRPQSRLLMPLAFGSLLGGLTTLIGTPPNLLASNALAESGLAPFRLFDFTPVGGTVMLGGIAFVALLGRRWLPLHSGSERLRTAGPRDLREQYALDERFVVMRIGAGSPLAGKSLRESRMGSATGLNVIAVARGRRSWPAPDPDFELRAEDRLLVEGRLDRFNELRGWRQLRIETENVMPEELVSEQVDLSELRLAQDSALAGRTLGQAGLRKSFGVIVLAMRRGGVVHHSDLAATTLEPGDRLLVLGFRAQIEALRQAEGLEASLAGSSSELAQAYRLEKRLFAVSVPDSSVLDGKSLAESRIGDAFRLGVLGIVRQGQARMVPAAEERLRAGDRLLVRGERQDLDVLQGLQTLEIESETPRELAALESEQMGLVEAVLSPHTTMVGKTLRDLKFRERFGLQVLAIFREGRAYRSDLRNMALRFGDALLLFGRSERILLLAQEPDLLALTQAAQPAPRTAKAPVATLILAAVLLPVLLGWLPISIGAVVGATLMILTGCMTMEQAYRAVEWRSVFLIAGMLPLGTAMHQSGAAAFLAEGVLELVAPFGPLGALIGLYCVTAAATSIIPTAALVVLMAPIALQTSSEMGVSPHAMMMGVALAASASFTSPISHPANILVMGPGGYRFVDYLKLGLPLTLVVLVIVLLVLPLVWPLQP